MTVSTRTVNVGPGELCEVSPAECVSFPMRRGQTLTVRNTFGGQVVDLWAHGRGDWLDRLSMEHTRVQGAALRIATGASLFSTRRLPMITMIADTSGGHHDMLLAACDPERYERLGHRGWHANCADGYRAAASHLGHDLVDVPAPFNLFERVSMSHDGTVAIEPPTVRAGDHCSLRAECSVTVILSVCPQDLVPTNGAAMTPRPVSIGVDGTELPMTLHTQAETR